MNRERVGRYEIVSPLGRGGMARVDLARTQGDAGFVRLVALKRLHRQLVQTPSIGDRFRDEAMLAGRIRHPNVVSVVDVVVDQGELSLAFELVVGVTLRELLHARLGEGVPTALAVRIALDVLDGLHGAHTTADEQGTVLSIVHRDVSPANILIDEAGVAKVTDFGLATARKRLAETAPGMLHGTVAYMAPERLRSEHVDARCDVYSASVILWEMLSGRKLFDGQEGELVWRILEGVVPRAGAHRPDVTDALAAVVARGLARASKDRFSTAREMALALEEVAPPAPTRALAEWLATHAKEELSSRRALVQAALLGTSTFDEETERSAPPATRTLSRPPARAEKPRGAVPAHLSQDASSEPPPGTLPVRTLLSEPPPGTLPVRTLLSEPPPGTLPVRTLLSEPPPGTLPVRTLLSEPPPGTLPVRTLLSEPPPGTLPVPGGSGPATQPLPTLRRAGDGPEAPPRDVGWAPLFAFALALAVVSAIVTLGVVLWRDQHSSTKSPPTASAQPSTEIAPPPVAPPAAPSPPPPLDPPPASSTVKPDAPRNATPKKSLPKRHPPR